MSKVHNVACFSPNHGYIILNSTVGLLNWQCAIILNHTHVSFCKLLFQIS